MAKQNNRIENDIRAGTFARVYLLWGDEDYLKQYYKNALIKALIPDDNTINLNVWNEAPVDVAELMEQARTMPFFAEHRLIVVCDSGLFKRQGQALAEFIPSLAQETVLLFVEHEVDQRSALYKAVSKNGVVMKLDHYGEKELEEWVHRRMVREGRPMVQTRALKLFMERAGDDMQRILSELEKLICYTQGRDTILIEDVQAVIPARLENHIYEMADLIAYRKRDRVLEMYHELLELKEQPLGILGLLTKQFMRLLMISEMREQGLDIQTISDKTGIKAFIVRKCAGQCSMFTYEEIRSILGRMSDTDADIKMGRISDREAVELLICEITKNTR